MSTIGISKSAVNSQVKSTTVSSSSSSAKVTSLNDAISSLSSKTSVQSKVSIQDLESQRISRIEGNINNSSTAPLMSFAFGTTNGFTFGLINSPLVSNTNSSMKEYNEVSTYVMAQHPVAATVGKVIGSLPYMAVGAGEAEGAIDSVTTTKNSANTIEEVGKSSKWIDEAGNIKWPANEGFAGTPKNQTLEVGTQIDRYGSEYGSFASPKGTSYEMRSLAPGTESKSYNVYEVVKPVEVKSGKIAPWFDQQGGGIQYKFSQSINGLRNANIIRKVK